jgi:hypothetical protein
MTARARPAFLEYSVFTRSDKPPKVGDTIQLGSTEYTVAGLRVRVELRPVRDDDDIETD